MHEQLVPYSAAGEIAEAIGRLSPSSFVITSAFEGRRAGVLARSVQACANEPVLIAVAVKKGHRIEPLIRDSHGFAVSQVDPCNRLIQRIFNPNDEGPAAADDYDDPFVAFHMTRLHTKAPVFRDSHLSMECEVVRRFDLEADHELFIGQVMAVRTL